MRAGAAESRAAVASQRQLCAAREVSAFSRPFGRLAGPETARVVAAARQKGRWSSPPASRPPSREGPGAWDGGATSGPGRPSVAMAITWVHR
jgi:hypothetical protein